MVRTPLPGGHMPLYEQLKQRLRTEITQGAYQPGDRLPSEPELIRQYGISRITVRQALDELEAEGLVVRRHGKGTYVAEPRSQDTTIRLTNFVEDMVLAGLSPSSRLLRLVRESACPAVAEALQVTEGTEVVRVDRLRSSGEQPIAVDTTWLPLRFGGLLAEADLAQETIYRLLEIRYGVRIAFSTFHITAVAATLEQATLLETAVGSALLLIQRRSFTKQNEPVYVQDRYYHPDRVYFQATLQQSAEATPDGYSLRELRPVFRNMLS